MAYHINDRWLWLGTGVALFIAVKGISYAIRDIVRLTAIESLQDDQEDEHQKQPEDSISLDVLQTLATSPNPNISNSAIDLIVARCWKTEGLIESVQADAASSDPVLRGKARTAVAFLRAEAAGNSMGRASPHDGLGRRRSPSVISNDYEFDNGPTRESDWFRAARERGFTVPSEEDPVAGWAAVPRERDSSDEAELRRRRREAMVLHEGVGGLGEEDIIRPRMR